MYESIPCWIVETPDHLKTQQMCDKTMCLNPLSLPYVPDHLQMQEMCDAAVREDSCALEVETQETCDGVTREDPDYFMMKMIIIAMMIVFCGLKRTQDPESKNKRRVSAHCLAP